jgi:hypothetical protein
MVAVFQINFVSIHPHFTFDLPGQFRTTRRICRAHWAHSSPFITLSRCISNTVLRQTSFDNPQKYSPIVQLYTIKVSNAFFPFFLLFSATFTSFSYSSSSSTGVA